MQILIIVWHEILKDGIHVKEVFGFKYYDLICQ